MNILQINLERGWRGGEHQTLLCLRALRQAGHQVEPLARRDEPLAQKAKADGFIVHEGGNTNATLGYILSGKLRRYDIIHCQTASSLTWPALLRFAYNGKLVFTRRVAFPVKPHKQKRTKTKWARTDLFVGISNACLEAPKQLGLLEPTLQSNQRNPQFMVIPIAFLPMTFDRERFEEIVVQKQLQNKKIIGVVAALTEEKDPNTQIEAIHQLYQRRQDIAVLHFGSGHLLEVCQAKVKNLGLEKVYHFMGFEHQVERLYPGFAAYCLTSRYEAANNGIINSFFNRIPVVATASGGPSELLADQRGYLCPVGDVNAVAEALSQALDDGQALNAQHIISDREQRLERAYDYVQQNNTLSALAKRYTDAYQALLT